MTDVHIPATLWDEDIEGAISVWLVEDGDTVAEGAVLCEVMAEKVSFEIAAPADGKVTRLVEAEVPVSRGDVIARLGA